MLLQQSRKTFPLVLQHKRLNTLASLRPVLQVSYLVPRAWRERSQKHLFSVIDFWKLPSREHHRSRLVRVGSGVLSNQRPRHRWALGIPFSVRPHSNSSPPLFPKPGDPIPHRLVFEVAQRRTGFHLFGSLWRNCDSPQAGGKGEFRVH